jgi:hypothetical protein
MIGDDFILCIYSLHFFIRVLLLIQANVETNVKATATFPACSALLLLHAL